MNKLQLYIAISCNGFRNMVDINPVEEVKSHVEDLSVALEEITYNPLEKNIFYLLKYTDQGVFLVVIRTIPDKPADHLASWIFIPYEIEISEGEIENMVNAVLRVVSNAKITSEDLSGLRRLFGKTYEVAHEPGATVANYGKQYAHRFYGGDTGYLLSDYIGNKRYQTSYLQYAGVILADRAVATHIAGPNLTDDPLDQMVKIFPPRPDDRPYRPLIFDRPFTHPFLVPLMGTVEIVWESSSAVDIRQSIMINKPNMRPDNISLQSTRPGVMKEPQPAVNVNVDVPAKSVEAQPAEKAAHKAEETEAQTQPQPSVNDDPRTISYDRNRVYHFEIPAKSANISGMIHFEIQTRSEITGSPIDGYELTGAIQEGSTRSNHLIYAPTENLQTKAMWGVIGFVVGILLTVLCTCAFSGGDEGSAAEDEYFEEQTDSTTLLERPSDTPESVQANNNARNNETAPQASTGGNIDDAIKYLDTEKTWDKAKMDAYPDLKGLYDDMNSLNRQRLVDYWGPKLKESRTFAKIVDHCQKALKANKKCRTTPGGNTYNKPSDSTINTRSFLNTIDP